MDPVLALAILSFGAFAGTVITALFYVGAIRPSLLAEEREREAASSALRSLSADQAGGGESVEELRELLRQLLDRLKSEQTSPRQADDQLLTLIRELDRRLVMQSQQFDTLTAQVNAEFSVQDQTLKDIRDHLGISEGGIASFEAVVGLGVRLNALGEQVDTIADQLLAQDALLREMHAQVTPTDASETLYNLVGRQAARLNEIAWHLQDFDQKLRGGVPTEALPDLSSLNRELDEYGNTLKALNAQLKAQEMALRQQLENISSMVNDIVPDVKAIRERKTRVMRPVRLTDIKGIGPVYANLLYEGGVQNYKQLAALTPEEVRNLIKVPSWRKVDVEGWIEQAKLLASQHDKLEATD